MSCHVILYYVISYHIISYHIISYYDILSYIILCYIILYHTISYHIIVCYIIVYYSILSAIAFASSEVLLPLGRGVRRPCPLHHDGHVHQDLQASVHSTYSVCIIIYNRHDKLSESNEINIFSTLLY